MVRQERPISWSIGRPVRIDTPISSSASRIRRVPWWGPSRQWWAIDRPSASATGSSRSLAASSSVSNDDAWPEV